MQVTSPTTVGKVGTSFYHSVDVTPSDSADLATGPEGTTCKGLQVVAAGNVNVNLNGGGTAVLTSLVLGQILPIAVTRVLATSTTATVRALY